MYKSISSNNVPVTVYLDVDAIIFVLTISIVNSFMCDLLL